MNNKEISEGFEQECIGRMCAAVAVSDREPAARDFLAQMANWFKPAFFQIALYQRMCQALFELHSQGAPIAAKSIVDAMIQSEEWNPEDWGPVREVLENVARIQKIYGTCTWGTLPWYAGKVYESWRTRSVADEADKAATDLRDGTKGVDQAIEGLSTVHSRYTPSPERRQQDNRSVFDELLHESENPGPPRGTVSSTLTDMDEALKGGFRPGSLSVFGARTGEGKSSFMGHIALSHALNDHKPVLIFSVEMSNKELMDRFASWVALDGDPPPDRYREAIEELRNAESQLKIISGATSINAIDRECLTYVRQRPETGLIMVDYIQLVVPEDVKGANREQQVASITRRLKQLAMATGVPVLAASQLSREANKGKPEIGHLRESGAIEQDANNIVLLEPKFEKPKEGGKRPKEPIKTLIKVGKNRGGPRTAVGALWYPSQMRYVGIAPDRFSEFDDFNDGERD